MTNPALSAPDISAALRESVPGLPGFRAALRALVRASKSLVLTVGDADFTVNYDGADIFLPSFGL